MVRTEVNEKDALVSAGLRKISTHLNIPGEVHTYLLAKMVFRAHARLGAVGYTGVLVRVVRLLSTPFTVRPSYRAFESSMDRRVF